MYIQRWRCARCFDATKSTAAGAGVTHEHDGGCRGGFGTPPAVGDVRAARFFTDSVQIQTTQVTFYGGIGGGGAGGGYGSMEPGGEAGDLFLADLGGTRAEVSLWGFWSGGEVGEGGSGVEAVCKGCGALRGGLGR